MGIANKILRVMTAVRTLGVDSHNNQVGYDYVSAAKLYTAVNNALAANGIVALANTTVKEIMQVETVGGKENFATVEVEITLIDVDGDEKFTIRGAGQGIDAGDKAIAKAQTMAVKYAYKNTFLIADKADDPDANANTKAYGIQKPHNRNNFVAKESFPF